MQATPRIHWLEVHRLHQYLLPELLTPTLPETKLWWLSQREHCRMLQQIYPSTCLSPIWLKFQDFPATSGNKEKLWTKRRLSCAFGKQKGRLWVKFLYKFLSERARIWAQTSATGLRWILHRSLMILTIHQHLVSIFLSVSMSVNKKSLNILWVAHVVAFAREAFDMLRT